METSTDGIKIQTKKKFEWGSLTIILLTSVLFVVLSLTSSTFLSYNNVHSILYGVSINFFVMIGFVFLLIMGELDLSVGSVCAFSGMMVGYLMRAGTGLVFAIIISLLMCVAIGFLNGFFVVKFKVASMMVTLGSLTAVRGLANVLCSNLWGYDYPRGYQEIAKVRVGGGPQAMYLTIIVMIVLTIILEISLNRSSVFKKLYFVGNNIESAKVYGARSGMYKIVIFMVSALTAGIGGILTGARLGYAGTEIGVGLEFTILTAVVLGGASLRGGKGSLLRSAVGLIFLSMMISGMIIYNINPLIQQLIVGIILIAAVFIDTQMRKMAEAQ